MSRAHFVPPAMPKTPKAAATRRRIMGVAAELFIERGYGRVSMQDIADRAQLTKGGVYGHFRSKGQLLVEVIRWRRAEREHSASFSRALRDPETAISLLFDQDGRSLNLLIVDAGAAARHDPDVAAGMVGLDRERQTAIRDGLVGVVSDPATVAWLVGALAMGIGMKESISSRPPALDAVYAVLRVLADGADP